MATRETTAYPLGSLTPRKRMRFPSVSAVVTAFTVGVSMLFVLSQLHPDLLVLNTTTAGGDMGAHVWAPQYLEHHLLPHGRVTGWAPDWYNGFPALTFYFPLPSLLIVVLDTFLPYGVAFKIVTVSGVVAMPLAAWALGRFARLPFPAPACLAAASLLFLFDKGYTILGGNIASTLAGEYSFSIGFSLCLVLLGLIAGGLETGKHRAAAAILFALVITSHILPTIFAIVGGGILILMRLVTGRTADETATAAREAARAAKRDRGDGRGVRWLRLAAAFPLAIAAAFGVIGAVMKLLHVFDAWNGDEPSAGNGWLFASLLFLILGLCLLGWQRDDRPVKGPISQWQGTRFGALRWAIPVGVVGGLLSSFWAIPFVFDSPYMNDMGWEKIGTGVESGMKLYDNKIVNYTDALFPSDIGPFIAIAILSALIVLVLRRRIGIFFVLVAVVSAAGFVLLGQGRLWNARLLPFWYFSIYMLVGLFIAEFGWGLADAFRKIKRGDEWGRDIGDALSIITPIGAVCAAMLVVMSSLTLPDWWKGPGKTFWHSPNATASASFIPGWAQWNYSGYERKAAYGEYKDLVNVMDRLGKEDGCGRAMWEYEPALDRFGTPMALMLLPMWTNGCIGSQEGLFFESSATVPYHFMNQAWMSASPSSAMRNLPYGTLDVPEGVTRLQILGVRYYMAVSPTAQQQANADPRLTLVATSPAADGTDGTVRTWNIYKIADTQRVFGLQNLPAVMTDQKDVEPSFKVSEQEGELTKRTAWLGNSVTWYEDAANLAVPLAASGPSDWPRVPNVNEKPPALPAPPVNATNIWVGDDRISFDVDKIGAPVVVKESYFPNWKADGAKGPYRITPNLMVVIPTSKHVEMHYGRTATDWLGIVMSFTGLAGAFALFRIDRRRPLLARTLQTGAAVNGAPWAEEDDALAPTPTLAAPPTNIGDEPDTSAASPEASSVAAEQGDSPEAAASPPESGDEKPSSPEDPSPET